MITRFIFVLWSAALTLLLVGCSSAEKIDPSTAEGAFRLAKKYESDDRFEEAIAQYKELKNKFPYSRYATEAELKIADINFRREAFPEAESAYKLFKEFHPRHERIDYVTFQIGMSLFKQLPETIDRDLSLADSAVRYFDEVVNSYPKSDYVGSAKDHKRRILKMLAEKENYIANFYFIREKYDSALGRYEGLLQKYSGLGLDKEALYRATISAYRSKDKKKAREYYLKLAEKFPNASETQKAKEELTQ